tara:strand:- start:629 stop:1216 length:588 start_codon:yes stop_codon:yes gene_type:complete
MNDRDLLARAQLMLGDVSGYDEALSRALDELARERSRQRRWSWRDACDARAAVLAGACTTSQAAARLCLTARTLKLRWRALGMPKEPSSIAAAIRVAIESDPGATDQQIAQRLSGEGYVLSRVSVMRTRRAAGIESSFGRRLQAERDEVDEYVRAYPWMSAADVRGAMRADGWPWPVCIRRIARHVTKSRAAHGL